MRLPSLLFSRLEHELSSIVLLLCRRKEFDHMRVEKQLQRRAKMAENTYQIKGHPLKWQESGSIQDFAAIETNNSNSASSSDKVRAPM
jgi:hypothetical protein